MLDRKLKLVVCFSLGLMALVLGQFLLAGPLTMNTWAHPLRQWTPDVAVLKYKESGTFAPGHYVEYIVYFENESLYPATEIFIRDTLPISTTYVSSTEPGLTLVQAGPDKVIWHREQLTGFETGWASITVRVDDDAPVGATVENIVRISTFSEEENFDNNEYTLREEVLSPGPDLAVRKELQSGTPGPGSQLTYRIHYKYTGTSAAHNVRISDTLPISTTYVSDVTPPGFTTVVTDGTVVWEKASIPADSYGYMFVTVLVSDDFNPAEDWLENVAEISMSEAEANLYNNLSRHVWKPEPTTYGAAVTSVDDKTMRLLSDGGFDWMIYYLSWAETEPQDNQYYWRDLDDAIWKAWWYNLRLIVRVDRAPAWARPPGSSETAPPTDPAKLGEFLNTVANHSYYGQRTQDSPRIAGYIIWNEPNLAWEWGGNPPDAPAYTALLEGAWNGIKAADSNALVISAGLAPTSGDPPNAVDDHTYLQAILDNGACNYLDLLGVNPMGFASAPDDISDPNGYNFSRALEWRDIMDDYCADKQMFATEMGWLRDTDIDLGGYDWMKVSLIDQAHYLARAYHRARREWPWMGPMMTWNLDFAGFYENIEHFHWFSVTDSNLDPLRPYLTLKNAATRGPADLWVEKELISEVTPGDDLVYRISCTNIGGQQATGVTLVDTFPDHTVYVSDSRGDGTLVGGSQILWDLSAMEAGARESISLTLHLADDVPANVLLTNKTEATVAPGEPYTDDNAASVTTSVFKVHYYLPLALRGKWPPWPPIWWW
jgi:uncharacterized repeat protein (TIGR01451 family)